MPERDHSAGEGDPSLKKVDSAGYHCIRPYSGVRLPLAAFLFPPKTGFTFRHKRF